MFSEYQAAVLAYYHQRFENETLSVNLAKRTPAGIKDELIIRLEQKEDFKIYDEQLLLSFIAPVDEGYTTADGKKQAFIRRLKRTVEKFKPLSGFLNGRSGKPDDRNIELLAWLIDFEPRPYVKYLSSPKKTPLNEIANDTLAADEPHPTEPFIPPSKEKTIEDKQPIINETADNAIAPDIPLQAAPVAPPLKEKVTEDKQPIAKIKWPYIAGALIIGIVVTLIVLINNRPNNVKEINKAGATKAIPAQGCMYWAQDRYIPIACDAKGNYPGKIALNNNTLKTFFRIIDTSDITIDSVGKVWYIEKDSELQLYNSPGTDPVDASRQLKPLTKEIYNKYWRHNSPLPNARILHPNKNITPSAPPQVADNSTTELLEEKANFVKPQFKTYTRRMYDPFVNKRYNAPALLLYLESIGDQGMLEEVKDQSGKQYPFKLELSVDERFESYREVKKFDQGQSVRISIFHPNAAYFLETLVLDLVFIDKEGRRYKQRITPTAESENWVVDKISDPQQIK